MTQRKQNKKKFICYFLTVRNVLWSHTVKFRSFLRDCCRYNIRLALADFLHGLSASSLTIWLALLKCQFSQYGVSQHSDGWRLCPVYQCALPQLTAWWRKRREVLTFSFVNGMEVCLTAKASSPGLTKSGLLRFLSCWHFMHFCVKCSVLGASFSLWLLLSNIAFSPHLTSVQLFCIANSHFSHFSSHCPFYPPSLRS